MFGRFYTSEGIDPKLGFLQDQQEPVLTWGFILAAIDNHIQISSHKLLVSNMRCFV